MQEGSITKYQRKNGKTSWGYYIRLRDENGKWKPIAKQGFDTKTEAQQARDSMLEANGRKVPDAASIPPPQPVEEPTEPPKPLFSELLSNFLAAAGDCRKSLHMRNTRSLSEAKPLSLARVWRPLH